MSQNPSVQDNHALHFLLELRARLLNSLIAFALLFAVLMYFSNTLYTWLALPLLKFLPQGHLIATQIVSPFFVPFRLAFMAAFLLSVPFFLYQLWKFVSPALYGYEKKWLWPFLLVSVSLFYTGLAFAYFIIFPLLFHFLANVAPKGVILSPDISEYLDFTIKLLLIFGSLFEIPMVMVLLVVTKIIALTKLVRFRPYAIISAFVIGMLLAPPDVLSQTVLAIPIWILYEAGLLLARLAQSLSDKKHAEKI